MTRMIGPDCAVSCNLTKTHTHAHTHTLLERLPARPMASALLEELKKSQIEDAVGKSWAALATEEDPQGRGVGTLLIEAGAEGEGGQGIGDGRDASGGIEEVGMSNGENSGRIRWQPHLRGENELGQTNRGVLGVCAGVWPRVQSKFSRALHAHRGKKLLLDLQNLDITTMKIAMVRFGGA